MLDTERHRHVLILIFVQAFAFDRVTAEVAFKKKMDNDF